MLSLAGCSTTASPERSALNVFLNHDITDGQRGAVERRLHELPSVQGVSFETKEQAYERFKEQFKDAPDLISTTKPDSLPESFRATVTDSSLVEAIETVIAAAPGVSDVLVLPAATKSPPPTEGVVVQVHKDVTGDQCAAIEQAIRAIPKVKSTGFESNEAAYARLKKKCHDAPELANALDPDAVSASYRFAFTVTSGTSKHPPSVSLSSIEGVDRVLTVPVSVL